MANEVNIMLPEGKKRLVIAACIIMYFNYMVINTPFLQTTMPKENYGAAQGMIAFAGSAGRTICGTVAGAFLNSGAPMEQSLDQIYLVFGVCLIVVFVMGMLGVKVQDDKV